MKNKTMYASVMCAINGLKLAFRQEKNFKYYAVIAAIFFIFNILLKTSTLDLIAFILLCAGVFATEVLNTAIERLSDKVQSNLDDDIKFVKDVSAGSVLIFGIAFFTIEAMILIPKLL